MKHLDLFSGIGGFALAGLTVWGKDYECVGFCDIEKYAQELLKIRFPGVPIYEDIKKLSIKNTECCGRLYGKNEEKRNKIWEQWESSSRNRKRIYKEQIDLLTGGFPCQPFSMAGKRGGTKDDRYLWPEMLRVIKEFKPRWVIGENVFGLLSMGVNESKPNVEDDTDNGNEDNENVRANSVVWRIKQDLLNIGYDCEVLCIPACAVNAPHRRDRLWFIAHTQNSGCGRFSSKKCGIEQRELQQNEQKRYKIRSESESERRNRNITADSKSTGQQSREYRPWQEQFWGSCAGKNWIEVATRLCGVDDGLSAELDGFKLSKAGHRVARIKGLGNAIVPQVAIELMKFIKEIDDKK
jgi:DNA (cytosine-5)-methyltransferase 1